MLAITQLGGGRGQEDPGDWDTASFRPSEKPCFRKVETVTAEGT